MDYYVNATAVDYPMVNFAYVAPFEPRRQERPVESWTEFASGHVKAIDFFQTEKGPLAPTSAPSTMKEHVAITTAAISESTIPPVSLSSEPSTSEIDQIAKQRMQLLAAKYASDTVSSEIVARLEILNRRLSNRAPRVTVSQVTALEQATEQLAQIRTAREERAKRLGLSL